MQDKFERTQRRTRDTGAALLQREEPTLYIPGLEENSRNQALCSTRLAIGSSDNLG